MQPFDIVNRTRFVFGQGVFARLGELAAEFRPKCVLVVSDHGIVQAGHFDRAVELLKNAGLRVESFHDFAENPTSAMVDAGVRKAAEAKPDLLIGLGGGSSMDCCKGINFVYSCGGTIHDYHGVGKATADLLPMIAIPTTSGTGSEAQSFALISDAESHVKMACGDKRAACSIAVLDPELTVTQPRAVTALTGIDAISHAIETYVTNRRNPMSITYSRRAFGLLASGFSTVLNRPEDVDARSAMQLGACFAGMAIETSMLGAAHATANPLTARHDITHGQAVGLMLPAVIRLNGQQHADWYAELMREIEPTTSVDEAPEKLAQLVTRWLEEANLATSLNALQIPASGIEAFVEEALQQWTGNFNPVPLDRHNAEQLYRSVA
ncbi:iron-containing alcohol dehydrogenase [Rhodopirellula sp. MGV]|uniref:iron-containing alcohol dehydrogenase n=1 Tax=Rhodopirellula sp. MGV TaxID=2023130 RepID=UPI000B967EE1|nr:iron-containing alcohol dehydrogenase [Rhodopirellula sp. MGV]OYP33843.1 alcohol dehydrogenase [Rhodopirellula sp. MGV]PNY37116.1 iron-containing alcohol dehydrogenase [Rhodopirellula baltica]